MPNINPEIIDEDNYTSNALKLLGKARQESDRLNHNFIGTEHLLLGLIRIEASMAAQVLKNANISLEFVCMEVERLVGMGPDQKMIGDAPRTPRVKKVLDLAKKEAVTFKSAKIDTEHILLALLKENDGTAARALRNLKFDFETARCALEGILMKNESTPQSTDQAELVNQCKALDLLITQEATSLKTLHDCASTYAAHLGEGAVAHIQTLFNKYKTRGPSYTETERRIGTVLQILTKKPVTKEITTTEDYLKSWNTPTGD